MEIVGLIQSPEGELSNTKDVSIALLYYYQRDEEFKKNIDSFFDKFNKKHNTNISLLSIFDILQWEEKDVDTIKTVKSFLSEIENNTELSIILKLASISGSNLKEVIIDYIEQVQDSISKILLDSNQEGVTQTYKKPRKQKQEKAEVIKQKEEVVAITHFNDLLNISRQDFIENFQKYSKEQQQEFFDEIYDYVISKGLYNDEDKNKELVLSEVLKTPPLLRKELIYDSLHNLSNKENYDLPIAFIKKLYFKLLELINIEKKNEELSKKSHVEQKTQKENQDIQIVEQEEVQDTDIDENNYIKPPLDVLEQQEELEDEIDTNEEVIQDWNNTELEDREYIYELYEELNRPTLRMKEIEADKDIYDLEQVWEKYISKMLKHKILTKEQEEELLKKVKAWDKNAIDTLVKSNVRFVAKIAYKYTWNWVDIDDLIQEWILGLYEAVKKYDITKWTTLLTYAKWYIRRYIQWIIAYQWGNISFTTWQLDRDTKFWKRYRELRIRFWRVPSVKELAESLEISENVVKKTFWTYINYIELDKWFNIQEWEKEEVNLHEVIVSEWYKTLEEQIITDYENEELLYALSQLPEKHSDIIIRRHGLLNWEKETLESIAENLSIWRERVRQLQNIALKKIKDILLSNTRIPRLNEKEKKEERKK